MSASPPRQPAAARAPRSAPSAADSLAGDVERTHDLSAVTVAAVGRAFPLAVLVQSARPRLIAAGGLACSTRAATVQNIAVGRSRPPLLDVLPSLRIDGSALPPYLPATAIGCVLVLLIPLTRPHLQAGTTPTVLGGATVLTTVALRLCWLHLGRHWPTDILAGWLLGGSCVVVVWECIGSQRAASAPGAGARPSLPNPLQRQPAGSAR